MAHFDLPIFGFKPELAETALLFFWVTDVPKMVQSTKIGTGNSEKTMMSSCALGMRYEAGNCAIVVSIKTAFK